ncbi:MULTISPECIES: Sir2 family NAD-dependent protein deacetylase [Brevibacterium]|uniref:protein acetyllysine N-acetyltransferase n=1 Tax=Brevibacterium antiquum CNRZ 918 TaxID=1255637 RepID=A0A2H1IXY6_9MICO|nr:MULTISPECIES: Sir2 family NAD-dependent protein deacetylase [Brevibacterium]SMX79961.1 NAD-dependent protein deacetylase, SIR2 family [Brevibacterium antiquum CNRZ 918]HCG56445.1 NAD-dependent deacetylase [Brevibacterium sp.]
MAVIFDPLRGRMRPAASHGDQEIIDVLTGGDLTRGGFSVGAGADERIDTTGWAVLTGAGMSTDSGVPDYRGPDAVPRQPMTIQTFLSHPDQRARYWARSWVGWPRMRSAQPNAGHLGLAQLPVAGIVTQNVDGLHQAAASEMGSESPVIDLHGSLDRVICLSQGHIFDRDWVQARLSELNPDFARLVGIDPIDVETAPDGDVELEETQNFVVVDCPRCGGILKPDVVYFGDSVPPSRLQEANRICQEARGIVVLGSSLAVLSGLRFVRAAAKESKPVVIVTDGPTRGDELADYRSISRVADFVADWALRGIQGGDDRLTL